MSRNVAFRIAMAAAVVAFGTWWFATAGAVGDRTRSATGSEAASAAAKTTAQHVEATSTPREPLVPIERTLAADQSTHAPGNLLSVRVLDWKTGEELRDVQVRGQRPRPSHREPLGPPITLVEHGTSPVTFMPLRRDGMCVYSFRTPLHEWGWLSVAADETSVREVQLGPGGDVEIAFSGAKPPAGSMLRVKARRNVSKSANQGADGAEAEWADAEGAQLELESEVPPAGTIRADGLHAGQFVFSVEKGRHRSDPIVVGRTEATVVRGSLTRVVVHCEPVSEPPRVRVAGTLTISPAWGDTKMYFEPRGAVLPWHAEASAFEVTMQRVSDAEYRWDAGSLYAGSYGVSFDQVDHWAKVVVGSADNLDHRIVVPDPCEVRVRVVDSETLRPVATNARRVACSVRSPASEFSLRRLADRLPDNTFCYTMPPGFLRLDFSADGYVGKSETVEVRPGFNEFTLQAQRDFGIDVSLQCDGEEVPWRRTTARLLDESNIPVKDRQGSHIRPVSPGRYWLVLDNIDGFEADPVLVDVPEIGFAPVTVHLRRRH